MGAEDGANICVMIIPAFPLPISVDSVSAEGPENDFPIDMMSCLFLHFVFVVRYIESAVLRGKCVP